MTPRREVAAGIRAELPILLGVLPFGLIYGALALQAGIPPAPALAMSSIVFAGSAQFVATQLIGAGTPVGLLLLTTFVVNLRHLLYSGSLAPYLRPLRPAWKAALAYLLTDEAYVVAITHYSQTSPTRATPPSPGLQRESSRKHGMDGEDDVLPQGPDRGIIHRRASRAHRHSVHPAHAGKRLRRRICLRPRRSDGRRHVRCSGGIWTDRRRQRAGRWTAVAAASRRTLPPLSRHPDLADRRTGRSAVDRLGC